MRPVQDRDARTPPDDLKSRRPPDLRQASFESLLRDRNILRAQPAGRGADERGVARLGDAEDADAQAAATGTADDLPAVFPIDLPGSPRAVVRQSDERRAQALGGPAKHFQ